MTTSDANHATRLEQDLQIKTWAIESSINGIAIANLDGTLEYVNAAFLGLWGYSSPAEVQGKPVVEFLTTGDKADVVINQLRVHGGWIGELDARTTDGVLFHVQVSASMIKNTDGEPIRMMASFVDISRRKLAEEAFYKSENRFRRIVEQAPIAMAVVGMDGVIEFINLKAVTVFGYLPEDIPTMDQWWLQAYPEEDYRNEVIGDWTGRVEKALAENSEIVGNEYLVTCKNGSKKTMFISGVPVGGRLFVMFDDITEHKRAENLLAIQHSLALTLTTTLQLEPWLELCLNAALDASGMDCGGIYLVNDRDGSLDLTVHKGLSPAFIASTSHHDAQSPNSRLVSIGKPVYSEYTLLGIQLDENRTSEMLRALAVIPVLHEDRVIGCFNLGSHTRDDVPVFARSALETIAAQIGTGISRLKNEEALRESEKRFSMVFKTSPYAYIIANMEDGAIIEVNDAFSLISGFTKEEALASSTIKLNIWVNEEDRIRMVASLRDCGIVKRLETRLRTKNGDIMMVLLFARAIRLGQRNCILSIVEDITEQKKAELSLIASEQKYRDLANTVPVGIFEFDRTGRLTFVNTTLYEWFGYSETEFKAGISILDLADSKDRQRLKENMAQIATLQTSLPREYCLLRKNREEIHVLALTKPVIDQGQLQGFRGILLDLTEKKKTELALQKAQKLESLGMLAGGIAHDFNNLLTGIYGYIDLARSVSKETKAREYLESTVATMNRAKALTHQLLTFAKGGSPVQKITSLIPFIQEAIAFALSGSNISCRFDLAKNLWPCNIDKNQIGQVIDNIVINALQAMPDGGTLEIAAGNMSIDENEHAPLSKGKYVKISIRDFGIGIPRNILPRIFDPFYTTKIKGHGLGLATCYSIVNRHRGCIDVESEPGKGSTFHVYLPAASEPVSVHAATIPSHRGSGTIIVMDDEEVIRNTVRIMLESLGYTVVCKNDGKDAVDFFLKESKALSHYTALIFDLTIPGGMGGVEAAREIRKYNKEIPIFVASGYAENEVMNSPATYGFNASIAKPFTIAELSDMLNKYLK